MSTKLRFATWLIDFPICTFTVMPIEGSDRYENWLQFGLWSR